MRYNFCTLFDKNYLYKGVALYNSMRRNCNDFKLWILCMDDKTFEILQKMKLVNTELIPLADLENEDIKLLAVKMGRNAGEYSWTCKPSLVAYIFKKYNIESLVYLDSDLFFFSSPDMIYKELENNSILLTPHRFPPLKKSREKTKGKYNAGTIFFKNDETTKNCLKWWRERCLEWCFHRFEDGKLGDQMYLDSFSKLFPEVHDIKLLGVNLGPWSLNQYNVEKINNKILIDNSPLILFHFHALKIFSSHKFSPGEGYDNFSRLIKKIIYNTYYKELKKVIRNVKLVDKNFNFGYSEQPNLQYRTKNFIRKYYHKIIAK